VTRQGGTLFPALSVAKAVKTTLMHLFAQRGPSRHPFEAIDDALHATAAGRR
jgi:hypothetical protein